jgi:hypothetical protein
MARRDPAIGQGQIRAAVTLAVLPDLLHLIPIALWALAGDGPWSAVASYAVATPSEQPWLPDRTRHWSHHLHCAAHSAAVAAAASLALGWWRWWRVPLAGWGSHIVIDVFTHSNDFYPSPVFYPFSTWGFDGVAWPTPWFMALNYTALFVAALYWVRYPPRTAPSRPSNGDLGSRY